MINISQHWRHLKLEDTIVEKRLNANRKVLQHFASAASYRLSGHLRQAYNCYREILTIVPCHLGAQASIFMLEKMLEISPGAILKLDDDSLSISELSNDTDQCIPSSTATVRSMNGVIERDCESSTNDYEDLEQELELLLADAKFKQALECSALCISRDPSAPMARIRHANILRRLGMHRESRAFLEIEASDDFIKAHLHLSLGELSREVGDLTSAVRELELAYQLESSCPGFSAALCRSYLESGRSIDARNILNHAFEQHPSHPVLLDISIDLHSKSTDYEAALVQAEILHASSIESDGSRLRRGHLYRMCNRHVDALKVLENVPESQHLKAHFLKNKGEIYQSIGEYELAFKLLSEAVETDTTCIDHSISLCYFYLELGAFDQGLEYIYSIELQRIGGSSERFNPWLRLLQVNFHHARGEYEAGLAISQGLIQEPAVGFSACCHQITLLSKMADSKAGIVLTQLDPITPHERLHAKVLTAECLMRQYRFQEAIVQLAGMRPCSADNLHAYELLCLLLTLVMDLSIAQSTYHQIVSTKTSSTNARMKETARHGLHRCLLEEFNTNIYVTSEIRALWSTSPANRLKPLVKLLKCEPGACAAAISLLISARQSDILDSWSNLPNSDLGLNRRITGRIPPVIIQFWNDADIPDGVKSLMQTWPQLNPSFTHLIFSQNTAAEFIAVNCTSSVQAAFDSALSPVVQSDIFRLAYLSVNGGIYADADDRCRHSLAPILDTQTDLIIQQEDIGSIGNNFIAASPGHPFIRQALHNVCINVLEAQGNNPWFLTGPGVLSLCFAHMYANYLDQASTQPPKGVRLFTQHELSRRISFHLQTPVKVNEGTWAAPRGNEGQPRKLIKRRVS